jgi:glycosyltransferase involved in cell wall biosynthesis
MSGQEDFRAELADVFQEAAAVHCVSRHIAEVAVGLGLPPEKARVIYTAVDTDFFRPDPRIRKPGPFEIASVGSAIWRKGYEYLLLALRHLIDVGIDARLRIADFGGPERERIRYTAEDLGLGDRVHLLGRLAPDGVRELLQTSDLFALATLSEGISNAVVEAMACSLPVVVSDCGGMREAVTDGVEGLVVPTRSPHAMAEAIAQLATAPALRSEMGRAGRDRAVRDFSMARQAREFIALYKEILCARPQAAKAVSPAAPDGPGAAGEADASGVDVARSPDDPGHSAGKPRPLRILTVADLDWRNGHEYAVQAMRELDRRGVSFEYWIIGRGPFYEAIAFAIHELGLGDRVRVILGEAGAFDGGTPEIADVFLLAAVGDGASSAIAAAADRGLAIVCTELARPINLAARDPWIQIIPGRDPAAIADRLTTLAASIYQTK